MYEPRPAVPEGTSDLPAILRLHAAEFELRSSRPMSLPAKRTANRYVVIRDPADAPKITNYRTFTPAEIVDLQPAACLLRDDMPTIIGSRRTVWPSLCTAMDDWSEQFVADRADILHVERTSWRRHEEFYSINTAYAPDVLTNEVGKRDLGEEDISFPL